MEGGFFYFCCSAFKAIRKTPETLSTLVTQVTLVTYL